MEQTVNLFNKGLQMDTHPMVQGNDTLSDALNATFVTMNGNEVILQNDMGNRRVNEAFLPSGYLPVGIKEYGGIIYVASYNPITNKSLIGSFPSPLKKIDSTDDPELNNSFDFSSILSGTNIEPDDYLGGINVIKSDSFMIPLTKDISLRAGDKFAIYSCKELFDSKLSSMQNEITNYRNIAQLDTFNRAYSPKNRRYTLLVGILNSLNEFVDITKTLCRWENKNGKWSPITYDSEKSDVYKFNDGYFISDEFDDPFLRETIEDSKLIKKRQKLAANTYSYKLVGPMYLKINLNHIENFNYNIYGIRENNGATLWIEGYITYNCPDDCNNSIQNSNENYYTFEEGTLNFLNFKIFDLIGESDGSIEGEEKCVYNPNNNSYTTKVVKRYEGITGNNGSNIYNYTLGVLADKDTSNIYLRGLSVKGLLDLSLLGSGKLFINGWRFYNSFEKQTTIFTVSFNAYPKYGLKFDNLKFTFLDIVSNETYYYPRENIKLPLYNGRQTYNIGWGEELEYLKPRKLYRVIINYDIINTKTGEKLGTYSITEDNNGNLIDRWFLTTELFNEFYLPDAGVPDFCDLTKADGGENGAVATAFKDKMNVGLQGAGKVKYNINYYDDEYEGSLTSKNTNIKYQCNHKISLELPNESKLSISNENLYPDFIKIKPGMEGSVNVSGIKIKAIGESEVVNNDANTLNTVFKNQLQEAYGRDINLNSNDNVISRFNTESSNMLNVSLDATGKSTFEYKDLYVGTGEEVPEIENAFDKVSNIIDEALPNTDGEYGGIVMNFNYNDFLILDHYIDMAKLEDEIVTELPKNDDLKYKYNRIAEDSSPIRKIFTFSKYATKIYEELDSSLSNKGKMFLYVIHNLNYFPNDPSNTYHDGHNIKTRLWWRTSNGEWATFNDLLDTNRLNNVNAVANWIKGKLTHDYIYCMYNDYIGTEKVYAPKLKYIYYKQYNIPLTLELNYEVLGNDFSNIIEIQNATIVGNLKFEAGTESNINSSEFTINLKSSLDFFDFINHFKFESISNIYLPLALLTDSKGRKLDKNRIYYLDNNKLIRIDNNYFAVDKTNLINGKNTLVCNNCKKGTPNNCFLAAGENTHLSILLYDSVNIVQS